MSLGDAMIECIEKVEFEDIKELRGRERYHIELNRDVCLNTQIPNRTKSEYYIDNADKARQYQIDNADRIKQYRIDNADKIRKRVKKYEIDNADKKKERSKQYRIDNADKLHEKFNCECGGTYTHGHKSIHSKSLKHQNYIASII